MSQLDITNMKYNLKRYFRFSAEETKYLIITILILGLVVGMDDGRPTFEMGPWLLNLLNSILIVTLILIVKETGHRVGAIIMGFRAEYKIWYAGLIVSLLVAVLTRGKFWFLLVAGGIICHHMTGHRIGYFRYGLNYWTIGMVAASGIAASMILALILKIIMLTPLANPLVEKALIVNLIFMLINALPIPPLIGANLFFASRPLFAYVFGFVLGMSILLFFANIWLSLLGALVIGGIIWALFMYFLEVQTRV